jgi:hypothetical protein
VTELEPPTRLGMDFSTRWFGGHLSYEIEPTPAAASCTTVRRCVPMPCCLAAGDHRSATAAAHRQTTCRHPRSLGNARRTKDLSALRPPTLLRPPLSGSITTVKIFRATGLTVIAGLLLILSSGATGPFGLSCGFRGSARASYPASEIRRSRRSER